MLSSPPTCSSPRTLVSLLLVLLPPILPRRRFFGLICLRVLSHFSHWPRDCCCCCCCCCCGSVCLLVSLLDRFSFVWLFDGRSRGQPYYGGADGVDAQGQGHQQQTLGRSIAPARDAASRQGYASSGDEGRVSNRQRRNGDRSSLELLLHGMHTWRCRLPAS